MVESEEGSGGGRREKVKGGIRSLFRNPKNKTGEQSSPPLGTDRLPTTIKTNDEAKTPVSQPTSSKDIAQSSKPGPICELWNEAYEGLKDKEERLMKDYEAAISKDMTTILASTSLALAAPQVGVRRREQMAALLEKKTAEAKKNTWKLIYGTDNEVLLRDLAGTVVNIIKDAENFVDGAVSANPYASIAWAGVSLLLPVCLSIRY
jgi:hypothetical protein